MLDVATLEPGDAIDAQLAVTNLRGLTSYGQGLLFTFELGNATGSLPAKLWLGPDEDTARKLRARLEVGDIVHAQGRINEYRGTREIKLETAPEPVDPDTIDPTDYLPGPQAHLGRLANHVLAHARNITNENLRRLVLSFWSTEAFQQKAYTAPATKRQHRARLGGLLEQTASLLTLTEPLTATHPQLDKDLITAAILLRPAGTLQELEWNAAIDITDPGRLIGPGPLAWHACQTQPELDPLDAALQLRLQHLLLTAETRQERGTGSPRTPEAVALNHLVTLDKATERATQAAQTLQQAGETSGYPENYRGYLDAWTPPPPDPETGQTTRVVEEAKPHPPM